MCKVRQYKRVKLVNEIQSASYFIEFYTDNHGCEHDKNVRSYRSKLITVFIH